MGMKKIGFISLKDGVTFCVYYDNKQKLNKYAIYLEAYVKDDVHEWPTRHRKLLHRYGNLSSCTAYIHQCVLSHDEESR